MTTNQKIVLFSFILLIFLWIYDTNLRIKFLKTSIETTELRLNEVKKDLIESEEYDLENETETTKSAKLNLESEEAQLKKQHDDYSEFISSFPVIFLTKIIK